MHDAAVAIAVAVSAVMIAATCVFVGIRSLRILDRLTNALPFVPEAGLPFGDIELLSRGSVDRAEAIKEFFEWKHKALLKLLELGVGFLLTNALVLLKLSIAHDDAASKIFREAIGLDLRAATIAAIASVSLVVAICGQRLRHLPDEYMIAITFLAWLRRAQ